MAYLVGELLQNYVNFIAEQMVEIGNALWGEDGNHSDQPIPIPQSVILNVPINTKGAYCECDAMDWGYGNFQMLYDATVNCTNGALSIEMSKRGRYRGHWGEIDSYAVHTRDEGDEKITAWMDNHGISIVKTTYPDKPIYPVFDNNGTTIRFAQENGGSNVYNGIVQKFTASTGELSATTLSISFVDMTFTVSSGGYWKGTPNDPDELLTTTYGAQKKDNAMMVTQTDNQTFINNYITNNDAPNNHTYTTTTGEGDTVTVYYGDNYIIYKTDPDTEITYNENKDILVHVANDINTDTGSDITVPDYTDIKPDPEVIIDDDYIDMGLGVETDGMAMYNMAVVTRDDLIQLITDFEANADTGLSFIPHVLGLYKLGFESSVLLTTITDKIRLHKEPGKTAFFSTDNYDIVENQEVLIDCGSITVDREELLTNTFLDFSPYSTYEMFIPGCGWITLPDTIVGRTISVAIVFDLTTCSCKGVVRSEGSLLGGSGTTLATVNGIIGSSVPLSINETGLQRAAIMNGSTQAAMALGTAFTGVGIGNPYMGASGIAMAAGALASNHIAGNSTYTSTKGGATDYSVFGDGWKAVLKITRPVLEIPDNYGHSVGFVVNRYDTLSNFSGFTVCVNPHIHISATSDEKEEIKRLLEEGVILPEGE